MHIPVLLKETIESLDPQPGNFVIDGTIGSGGHSEEILKRIGPKGKLLGIDLDEDAVKRSKQKFGTNKNVILVHGNYADLPEILKQKKMDKADGLLVDLGFSSEQIEGSGRGFSFLRNEPLDMRYDPNQGDAAMEVVNGYTEKDLAEIFWKYGEEKFSRIMARKIIEARRKERIISTSDLVKIIEKNMPSQKGRIFYQIHPATRIFQALRIYANRELENLEKLLNNLEKIVKPKGRVAIISFHSLEDRLVKNRFRELQKEQKALILSKKPILPGDNEVLNNPRARSAKLRVCSLI